MRSNESPSGAFKRRSGLRWQMEGLCPDKFPQAATNAKSKYFTLNMARAKQRPFQSFRLLYSSQMAVAPQGTTPPVAETGRPISSQLVLPPKRGTSVVLSIYSMTAGDSPVV